jgi:uncharacterized protein YcbK (DUF882 family)
MSGSMRAVLLTLASVALYAAPHFAGAEPAHTASPSSSASGPSAGSGEKKSPPGGAGDKKHGRGTTAKGEPRSTGRRSTNADMPLDRPSHGERGVVHMMRPAGGAAVEDVHVRLKDGQGRIPGATLKAFERMMRQGTATHAPDPRLVALVGIVSDHFGGRPLQVISGYRAYTPTQYTPHSNHNYGKALDFRIQGIPNEALRDFCLTLRNVGCGYYPNSTFVHLDVRDTKAYWVDRSRPGEPPLYDKPGVTADEGTSDVPNESSDGTQEPTRGESPGTRGEAPGHEERSPAPVTASPIEQSI